MPKHIEENPRLSDRDKAGIRRIAGEFIDKYQRFVRATSVFDEECIVNYVYMSLRNRISASTILSDDSINAFDANIEYYQILTRIYSRDSYIACSLPSKLVNMVMETITASRDATGNSQIVSTDNAVELLTDDIASQIKTYGSKVKSNAIVKESYINYIINKARRQ